MIDYADVVSRIQNIYATLSSEERKVLRKILQEIVETGESKTYQDVWLADYKEIPVDKKTFLTSPEYLGPSNNNGQAIYPVWMDLMLELERTGNQYTEIALTGATRTGKTSTAVSDLAYHLYKLMCLRDPQAYFGLKSITTISFFFFNITQTLAKGVAFREFNSLLSVSPWFQAHGHMNKSEATPTYIPEGGLVDIRYGSDSSNALGAATFGVVFDECNFAASGIKDINKAKSRMKAKYDTLVARVTGTFVKHGEVFGRLYIISSKNSDSDFMEDYISAQKNAGNEHMYVFDRPQWEVWPKSKYSSDETFKLALGGKNQRSFVVPDDQMDTIGLADIEKQGYKLIDVPVDNKTRFLADIDIAIRDIAGISVPGMLSFITYDQINPCISKFRTNPFHSDVLSIGTKDNLTIEEFFHLEDVQDGYKRSPMFIHLDLSLTTDRSGISGVVVNGRKDIDVDGSKVSMPTFGHLFTVALEAPRGDKIPYNKILTFICWLRKQGFNISHISRDQFQSEYMAQLLEAQGFSTDKISLDRTPDGYMTLRSVLLEQRIDMLHVELLEHELVRLQRDSSTGRVDHVEGGCFTGDTRIALVDGRELTILELLEEQQYRTNWVYTVDEETLHVVPKPILSVHQTKICSSLVRVTLDSGESFVCTRDHRVMLRDRSYLEASELREGQSLMPLYTKIADKGLVGYRLYFDPGDGTWHYEHRKFVRGELRKGLLVHHSNYNKLDNRPTNLQLMDSAHHRSIHNNHTQDYNKTSKAVSKYWKSIRGTDEELQRKTLCRDGIVKAMKRTGRYVGMEDIELARHARVESTFNVSYSNLSHAERISLGIKLSRIDDPSIQDRISSAVSKNHQDGKYLNAERAISGRVWYTDGCSNVYIKESDVPPEGFHRGRTLSDDMVSSVRFWYQTMSEDEKQRLSEVHRKDTANRIWVTDGVTDRYIQKDSEIPVGFHRGRCKNRRNHKVVSVEYIHHPCRVYDLTIQDNPNFALACGVFVHNSKDASDSFAGAIWNAVLQSPSVPVPARSVASAISSVNSGRRYGPSSIPGMPNIRKF